MKKISVYLILFLLSISLVFANAPTSVDYPIVGVDIDNWGDKINSVFDKFINWIGTEHQSDGKHKDININGSKITFEGSVEDDYKTKLEVTNPTINRTITLPDASGEVSLLGQIISLTETDFVGGLFSDTNFTTQFNLKTTSELAEGSNLYFTNLRAKTAIDTSYPNLDINNTDDFSGDYNDLINTPSLFSGDYNNLSNKPTLFSGNYTELTDKPTALSNFNNDLGYITGIGLFSNSNFSSQFALMTTSDLAEGTNQYFTNLRAKTSIDTSYPTLDINSSDDFTGDYNSLTNKPTIPINLSELSNNVGFISGGGSANKTVCWKADAQTLGYCSDAPDGTGSCTCN